MKHFTLNELKNANMLTQSGNTFKINCSDLLKVFANKNPDAQISGEELIDTLIDYPLFDNSRKIAALSQNHRFFCRISPESVGERAFKRVIALFDLTNCDFNSLYGVKNAELCSHLIIADRVKNCHYSRMIFDCENILFSNNARNKTNVVLDKEVSIEEFSEVMERVKIQSILRSAGAIRPEEIFEKGDDIERARAIIKRVSF